MKKNTFHGRLLDITQDDIDLFEKNSHSFEVLGTRINVHVNPNLLQKDFGVEPTDDIRDQPIMDPRIGTVTIRDLIAHYAKSNPDSQGDLYTIFNTDNFDRDGVGSGAFGSCQRISAKGTTKKDSISIRNTLGYSTDLQPSSRFIREKIPHAIVKTCSSRDWYSHYAELCMMHHAKLDMNSDTCLLPRVYCIVEIERPVTGNKSRQFGYMVIMEPLLKYGVIKDFGGAPISSHTDADYQSNPLHYELWQALYGTEEMDQHELSSFVEIKMQQTKAVRRRLSKDKWTSRLNQQQLTNLVNSADVQQHINFAASLSAFCGNNIHRDIHGGNIMVRYAEGKYHYVYTDPVAASETGLYDMYRRQTQSAAKEEIAKIDSPDVQTYLKAVLINGNRERIDRVVQNVLMGNKEPTKENIIERLVQNTNKMSGDEHGKDVVTYPEVRMEKWMNILRRRVVSGDGTVFDLGNINSFVECFKDELISALEDSGAFNAEYEINHKAFANLIVLKLLRNQAALTPEGKKAVKDKNFVYVQSDEAGDAEIAYDSEERAEFCEKTNFAKHLIFDINSVDKQFRALLGETEYNYYGNYTTLQVGSTSRYGSVFTADSPQQERATWGRATQVTHNGAGIYFANDLAKMVYPDRRNKVGTVEDIVFNNLKAMGISPSLAEKALMCFTAHDDLIRIYGWLPGEVDNQVWTGAITKTEVNGYVGFAKETWSVMAKFGIKHVELTDASQPVKFILDFLEKYKISDLYEGNYNTDSKLLEYMAIVQYQWDEESHVLQTLKQYESGTAEEKLDKKTLDKALRFKKNLDAGKLHQTFFNLGQRYMFARGIRSGAYFGE